VSAISVLSRELGTGEATTTPAPAPFVTRQPRRASAPCPRASRVVHDDPATVHESSAASPRTTSTAATCLSADVRTSPLSWTASELTTTTLPWRADTSTRPAPGSAVTVTMRFRTRFSS
jgi:hypothetical protein